MTLYDLRNDLETYSGIAIVCPQCGGPFPVEAFIRTEQCPLCETVLDLEMSVLHPVAGTDDSDGMTAEPETEIHKDAVQAVAETGTGTVEIASGTYAGRTGEVLAADWQRDELMIQIGSGEVVALTAEEVFGVFDGDMEEWEEAGRGLDVDDVDRGDVMYVAMGVFAGRLVVVDAADRERERVKVRISPLTGDCALPLDAVELRPVETVDGPATIDVEDDMDDSEGEIADGEEATEIDVAEPPRGETQDEYFYAEFLDE